MLISKILFIIRIDLQTRIINFEFFPAESEKSSTVSKEEMQQVINERDQALEDLQSVETAFSDLHRRYEKTKAVVEGFKKVRYCIVITIQGTEIIHHRKMMCSISKPSNIIDF